MLTVIDLFAGCGGISRGFERAGFRSLLALDNNTRSLETYALNHPRARVVDSDVEEVDPGELLRDLGLKPGELDCLAGGPPCQSFSKNTPARARFFDDDRNHLYKWFMDFVELFQPKTVLIENVAELANAYDGYIRKQIHQRLEAMGYKVNSASLLAADYGVPQMRRRVFFLASRMGTAPVFPLPTHVRPATAANLFGEPHYVTVEEAISDLPRLAAGEGTDPIAYRTPPQTPYQKVMRAGSGSVVHDHVARALQPLQLERIRAMKPGMRMKDLPTHLQTKQGYGGAYGRLSWEQVALTITTWMFHPGSGRYGHPVDDRTITIREAARIQSFDDRFLFVGSYNEKSRQVGNAVPPLLAYRLAEVLRACSTRSDVHGRSSSTSSEPYPIFS